MTGVRLAQDLRVPSRGRVSPAVSQFQADVSEGLARPQKELPCKYFYDREGSRLFDAICEQPEYYPTRTEIALLHALVPDFARSVPDGAALVEFGSGSSIKTRIVLDAAPHIAAYAPIDISAGHLHDAAQAIAKQYRYLAVVPVTGDFTTQRLLPAAIRDVPLVGFFPGSTIGNFAPDAARAVLRNMRETLGPKGRLLIGIDLVKKVDRLLSAYDDSGGVTASFNKNLLVRINRELGADIDLASFSHRVVWNAQCQRIEMHLVSSRAQTIKIGADRFAFVKSETIHTENSHKYTMERFAALAASGGWTVERIWESESPEYAVVLLR
jgi:dimethylhistidine N-methyltransferase